MTKHIIFMFNKGLKRDGGPSSFPCTTYYQDSRTFGLGSLSSNQFSVQVASLFQIVVFSSNSIVALQFFYTDGSVNIFGNPNNGLVTKIDTVQITNNDLIGVNLNYGSVINSIQFILLCKTTNVVSGKVYFKLHLDGRHLIG
jgi:hypothetical protein